MSTKRMKVWECDGCGHFVLPIDSEPYGFEGGTITFRDEHGGTGVKHWFACSEGCIALAVKHVIGESYA